MKWYSTKNSDGRVNLEQIPRSSYEKFYDGVTEQLNDVKCHVGHYFAQSSGDELLFYCLLLNDETGEVLVASHSCKLKDASLKSLAAEHVQMHPFEREIAELWGVKFLRSPWNKPLRFPHNRAAQRSTINNYPFYKIEGDSLHEVNVGPIHAGIIEPGAFRFMCNGERVLHLEIALGFQHRGVETLMVTTKNRLRQVTIAESIAGDSVAAHTAAYAVVVEKLMVDFMPNVRLEDERVLALELERIAVHIADTGALCADIGYQLGQVASEALRTIVINTTQMWCGNRFTKGLVRPAGSNFHLDAEMGGQVVKNIKEVQRRYAELMADLKTSSSLLSRFEDCGVVGRQQLQSIGAVGQAARAGGAMRDVRATHPWGSWADGVEHTPKMGEYGDVMSRLLIRGEEVEQSAEYVYELVRRITLSKEKLTKPDYDAKLAPNALSFALAEGWRGEICHIAITDAEGELELYKVKDPSLHNWLALALSVRGEGISDFPICNKSFSLSYCGHDL